MTTSVTKAVKSVGYFIATIIILSAAVVSLSRLLTPLLNHHRSDFEVLATRLLNVPVTIGEVHVSWNQYEPELAFEHVTILDKKTQKIPVFSIRRVRLDLNIFQSLLKHQWSLGRLNMTGAQLIVHQKPADQINIEGIGDFSVTDNLTGASMEANDVVTWIFSQSQLGLDDVNVRYVPLQGIAKSFTLNRLLLRNAKTTHTLAGQIVLNQDVQTTATFSTKWRGDITDLAHISGRIYLYLERISLPQWLKQFSWKHLRVMEGLGSIKIWIDWDAGQWQAVQSEFQFYELALQSQLTQKTRVVSRLSGSVGWKRQGDVQVVSGEDILIDFPKHLWPTTSFSAVLVPAANETVELQTLHLGYFDLEDTKELALASGFLPEAIQKKLLALDPVGEVHALTLNLHLPATDIEHISFSTKFAHLRLNAFENLPTFTNLSGAVAWDGQQGSLTVDSHPLSFILNSVFENPLQFDRLTGLLQWQKRAEGGWSIDAKNIIASNADMTAAGDMTLMIPAKESPTINLSSTFSMKNAGRISNYLPLKIFDPELVQWLRNAFQNGEVSSGKAIVQGKLSDFPFENGKGKFEIGGTVKALNLNYAPGWPPVENINGTLLFSGSAMTAEIESGKILTTPLTHVRGVIPYIGDKAPQVLTVEADPINTDFAQQLRFIHESPLEKTLGTNLAGLDLIGPMQLVLKLSIPLKNPEAVNVRGDVTLANATLRLPTWKLALDNLHGAFHFTEKLITATNIQGTLFGENAALNISTERPTKQPGFVKVSLQSHLSMTALQKWLTVPIEKFVQGSASYYVELHLISHEYAQPSQLILTSKLRGIQIDLPEPLGKTFQETKNFRLLFDIAQGKLLQAKLAYANLLNATMRYQTAKTGIRSILVDLNSAKIAGQFIVPLEKTPQPLQARLKYIYLPEISENNKKLVDPKILPALDVVVDNARYKDKNLGQISFNTVPNQRGLTIKSFTLNSSLLNLRAEGEWELQKNNYFTHLQGDLNTPNVSNFLNAWGLKSENLVGSGGKTDFNLTWKGAPYSPTMASMSGNIGIKLTEGRIVDLGSSTDTKMGFGRMLNIFSLQTIPRRLSLDFSDIFEKGYSFDIMKGDFKLENGNAFTRNAYFNGPIARVEIHGRVGFGARDYDLFLSVTPYVTSSLPVVATIAGGPLAGLATWLVDKVVSHEVSKVATYHYAVSGSWNNPSWKQVGAGAEKAAYPE